ncbi:MAG: hypothetical protein KC546_02945 [Anaerolineae bacterium]|nr:hypothetical protein [Anaerolineae bacterium]MCA9887296.1 hypothetical protein [Anaerolineae bacterium]MCB9460980.1 hypothetical protein [Anaerolineaceae bacterium]
MPVTASWHPDEEDVIWIHVTDPWTRSDLYHAQSQVKQLAASADSKVYTLTDFGDINTWPENLLYIHVANMLRDPPENRELAVVIANHAFLYLGRDYIKRLDHKIVSTLETVPSMRDALAFIRKHKAQK